MAAPQRTTRRKPRQGTTRRRQPPGGNHSLGGARPEVELLKLRDAVRWLMMHRASREDMSLALAKEFGRPAGTPLPLPTVDDHIAAVKEAWRAEAKKDREETTALQLQRLYRRLRNLKGADKYREAVDLERLIAKVEGNEAARHVKLTGGDGGPVEVRQVLTSDERRKRIAELMEKARAKAGAVKTVACIEGRHDSCGPGVPCGCSCHPAAAAPLTSTTTEPPPPAADAPTGTAQ